MTTEREVPDAHDDLFDGFVEREIVTDRGTVFARVGGTGPPVLLLHGYPQTHVMWRRAATLLAERFSVVAADLPGYGRSFRPPRLRTTHRTRSGHSLRISYRP